MLFQCIAHTIVFSDAFCLKNWHQYSLVSFDGTYDCFQLNKDDLVLERQIDTSNAWFVDKSHDCLQLYKDDLELKLKPVTLGLLMHHMIDFNYIKTILSLKIDTRHTGSFDASHDCLRRTQSCFMVENSCLGMVFRQSLYDY